MNYMITEPDEQRNIELKRILDHYEGLNFCGSYTTFEAAKTSIHEEPPDIAFIRMGKADLNSYELLREIREKMLSTKVVFISSQGEYAVDAFESQVDGFLLLPYDQEKIKQLLTRGIEKRFKKME